MLSVDIRLHSRNLSQVVQVGAASANTARRHSLQSVSTNRAHVSHSIQSVQVSSMEAGAALGGLILPLADVPNTFLAGGVLTVGACAVLLSGWLQRMPRSPPSRTGVNGRLVRSGPSSSA